MWIGVDFDGTLATDDVYWPAIGRPIPAMVELVKKLLRSRMEVRIFTARCFDERGLFDSEEVQKVEQWCVENLGNRLPITCHKDKEMLMLIDDRAVACGHNTGEILGGRVEFVNWLMEVPQ